VRQRAVGSTILKMRSPITKPERNVLRKLAQRELSRKGNRTFDRSNAQEKFRGFELVHPPLDTHDPKASHLRLSFLKKRSKITEIVAAKVLPCAHLSPAVHAVVVCFYRCDIARTMSLFACTFAQDIIFALAASGVCVAFLRGQGGACTHSLSQFRKVPLSSGSTYSAPVLTRASFFRPRSRLTLSNTKQRKATSVCAS
jgi:hypothetical protein